MSNPISRRDLLRKGSMIAVGLATPSWMASIAKADVFRQAKGKAIDPDGVLVVCQLSGGNDGLNTVIPYADSNYYRLRPSLGIKPEEVLRISEKMGLHPSLAGVQELYRRKKVAIVQGVGYPRPNRSHFKSMDIWNQANPDNSLSYGWLGRHLDDRNQTEKLNPVYALGLSTEKPKALTAKEVSVPCFASLADIQAMVGDPDAERLLREISSNSQGSGTKLVEQANLAAFNAMVALRDRLGTFTPKQDYGKSKFGDGFKQIAQLIATSPMTRVVYLNIGGFDTHARQADQHAALLKGLGDALLAFQNELEALGKDKKVVTMVFSEFGRRSFENQSGGTDHGAAAPMFVIGTPVKGGFYGPIPDFQNLADGDLQYAVDFRQVYATALDEWMGGDSAKVLSGRFNHLPIL